jgi:DNA-repair protein complementing XP-A cells
VPNLNNKRPLSVIPAASGSPTGPSSSNYASGDKLPRDSRLGKYFDYDLSKMVNSKGGFLVEDDMEADDDLKTKKRERERDKAMQSLEPRTCILLFHLTCVTGP